jgi:hypothetical protein
MTKINPLELDWTNVRQVIEYGRSEYGRGWCVVGPNRSQCYSIVKSSEQKAYCRKYKLKRVCELF